VRGEPIVAFDGHFCIAYSDITPRTIKREALLRFDGNSGYANAPQCNVVRTLVIFFGILLINTPDVPSSVLAF
jgi:hypothetical protein